MFNYNKKTKYKFLTPVKNRNDSILDRPEFMYPEDKDGKDTEEEASRVNYVRKPASDRSSMSFILSVIGVLFFLAALYLTLHSFGNPTLTVSAFAASSILFAVFAVWYGCISFLQKDRNYLFSYIGMGIGGLLLITWTITMIVGGVS